MRRNYGLFFKRKKRITTCVLILMLFGASVPGHTSTLEEVQRLEAEKGALSSPSSRETHSSVQTGHFYRLPDGRAVNTDDYRLVLFMQGSCHFCQQFDPQLAQLSAQTGFKVFPYTLDGQGDVSFPAAIPAPRAVLDQFFGPGNNGVTPTTWLVNVNTLQSWPLAQGMTDMNSLLQRINQALEQRNE